MGRYNRNQYEIDVSWLVGREIRNFTFVLDVQGFGKIPIKSSLLHFNFVK